MFFDENKTKELGPVEMGDTLYLPVLISLYKKKRKEMEQVDDDDTVKTHCCVAPLWLSSLNPFIEFRIWNNSSSSDVLYIQASISISPKYKSK